VRSLPLFRGDTGQRVIGETPTSFSVDGEHTVAFGARTKRVDGGRGRWMAEFGI